MLEGLQWQAAAAVVVSRKICEIQGRARKKDGVAESGRETLAKVVSVAAAAEVVTGCVCRDSNKDGVGAAVATGLPPPPPPEEHQSLEKLELPRVFERVGRQRCKWIKESEDDDAGGGEEEEEDN
ncbi:hypothetical protein Pcinc_036412 [Petrolisthes cinctipes]|uniref:Uncharacterized protein n=1 Tax=Petrolisthes cinctipes TaxID=88211 RepID=A0AAE1BUF5_PETCI|nr:hypothetical protein Pcinc_036412 [Petrolisthes cinctipes]